MSHASSASPLPDSKTPRMGPDGRLLTPAALRRATGLRPGGSVTARIEGDRTVPEDHMACLRRPRSRPASLRKPGESIVDEVLAMWEKE